MQNNGQPYVTLSQRIEGYAARPQAEAALFVLAVAEAVGLYKTTAKLLVPMAVLTPTSAFRFAAVATAGSLVGILGAYILGLALLKMVVLPLAVSGGYVEPLRAVSAWFAANGPLFALVMSVAPLPLTPVGWVSGLFQANALQVILAVAAGRGARHVVLAWLIWRHGAHMKEWIERNFFGLSMLVALGVMLLMVALQLLSHKGVPAV